MNKVANGMSPNIMNEIFQPRGESYYDLRCTYEFIILPIHNVYHDSKSVCYLRPVVWVPITPVISQIDTTSLLLRK